MKKIIQKTNILNVLLALMVIGEFVLLMYYNLATDYIYDQDVAKEMYHAIKIWENGWFIIPDWQYMTTGEWDCASFFAIFLYGATGNIQLSFAISNIINTALFVLIVVLLLRIAGVCGRNVLFTLAILLVPYLWGMLEYTNMLFYSGAQYIYKVLTPLCLLVVYHYRERYRSRAGYYALFLGTLFLLFLTVTSSGLYVAVCGVAAIYIARGIGLLTGEHGWNREHLLVTFLSAIVIVVSYYLHMRWGVNSSADSMQLYAIQDIPQNIGMLLVGYLNVYGILSTSATAFSIEGLSSLMRLSLVLVLATYGLSNIKRTFCLDRLLGLTEDTGDEPHLLRAELISITVLNSLVVLLTVWAANSRYLLIGAIPFVLLAMISYDRKGRNPWLGPVLFCLLFVINVFAQYNGYIVIHNTPEGFYSKDLCMRILDEAYEENVDAVVVYYRTELSETLRGYDSDMEVITYQSADNRFMDYDVAYGEKPISYIDDKECLIVMEGGFDIENTQDFIKAGYHYKDNIEDYSILAPNR